MPQLNEIVSAQSLGLSGNNRRIWAKCERYDVPRWTMVLAGKPKNSRCRHCALKQRNGNHNHNWKGGRHYSNGWIMVHVPSHPYATKWGYVKEHRLVIEGIIGRYLESGEVVHHLNGIKDDNRAENLLLTTSEEHNQIIPMYRRRIRELETAVEKLIDLDAKKEARE